MTSGRTDHARPDTYRDAVRQLRDVWLQLELMPAPERIRGEVDAAAGLVARAALILERAEGRLEIAPRRRARRR